MNLEHVLTDETTPEDVLRAQLGAGEHLLWTGRPLAGLRRGDYGRIALVLLACALATPLLWLLLIKPSGSVSVIVVGLIALFVSIGHSMGEVLQRSRTVYAVTDRRILVVTGLRSRKIGSYPLRDLSTVTLSEELPDGRGTIRFGPALLFDLIERAREVAETVRRAQLAVRFPASYPRPAAEAT